MLKNLSIAAVVLAAYPGVAFAAPKMHVHDSIGNLGLVDVETGDVSVIGSMGVTMTDIAFDPLGNLFGISFTDLYSINRDTAASTLLGRHSVPGGNALVFGSNGTLYSAGFRSNSLFSINPNSGQTTDLGRIGFASGGDLAFQNDNFFMASTSNELVKIDLANLSNTSTVGTFGVNGVFGLATDEADVLYAVAGTSIYTVNTATGAAFNPVVFFGKGLSSANGQSFFTESGAGGPIAPPGPIDPTSVPEPGMIGLLSLAAMYGLFLHRSKRLASRVGRSHL